MALDIEQLEADLAAGRTDDRRIEKLIAEVKRLRDDLAAANKVIVSLLGENADLLSRLRALGGERGGAQGD